MKYIEMYGLPGAGKTTISVPVIKKLREEGYRVAGLSDVYFRNCKTRRKTKVWLELAFSFKNYPLYVELFKYGLSLPQTLDNIRYLFKQLFFVHQIIKTQEEGQYDIALCEEGIIQHMTSLSYTQDLPDTTFLRNCILKLYKATNVVAINCLIDIETSLNRIEGRDDSSSRRFSSKTSSDLLLTVLNVKKRNLAVLAKYIPSVYEINMAHPVNDCKDMLYSFVKDIMK